MSIYIDGFDGSALVGLACMAFLLLPALSGFAQVLVEPVAPPVPPTPLSVILLPDGQQVPVYDAQALAEYERALADYFA